MSVASRIQEIETHIGDIYDTLEVGGTDLTDLNKNIVNINSSLKDRYKYFLNNGVEVIWNNWEKVIGEGTEFTLENTIQAPMKINLKGNTYQKSTTGKNLFDISKVLNNGTRVVNNGDGTLSVQAYGSSGGAPSYLKTYCPNLKVGDNVILTLETTSTNKFIYLSGTNQSWKSGAEITITQSDLDSSVLWYSNNNSTPATISNIMVRLSSITDDTYEPYTNGASPNPDYPQDIQVVSGDNSIKVNGENFFETFANGSITSQQEATTSIATIKQTFNYTKELTFNNGEITGYPAVGNGSYYIWKLAFNLKPNTKYTLSCDVETNNMTGASTSGNLWVFNNVFNLNSKTTLNEHISAWTFTTDEDGSYAPGQFLNFDNRAYQNTTTMRIYNIMLVEGQYTSSTMPTYQPYQSQTYPINLGDIELCKIGDYQDYIIRSSGKNLFDKNNYNSYDGYISGTGTVNIVSAANNNIVYIDCLPNTQYTVSKILSQRFRIGYSIDEPNSNVVVYGTLNGDSQTSLTITTGSDAKYLVIYLRNGNLSNELSLETILNSLQVEKGNQATIYEPYGKGKWYLHKETGKVVLDGSENWQLYATTYENYLTAYNSNKRWGQGGNFNADFLSDYFQPNGSNLAIQKNFLASSGYASYVKISDTIVSTIEELKTWFSNHNTTIYHAIKTTPTYTEITDTTLLSQLEAIYKAFSHDGQTNISQVNNDMPFKLEVTALKNI